MRALLLLLCALLTGCATPIANTQVTQVPLSTPVRWRTAPECLARGSIEGVTDRVALAAQPCAAPPSRDLVALALSGGGTKAAVFSGEALFYLDALGLLQRTSIVSSVSGGSFAGALYALSCDVGDSACQLRTHPGLARPLWERGKVMEALGHGYGKLVTEQVARLIVPFVGASISQERFADFIDETYLGRGSGSATRFTMADVNPRRPHLFLNATVLSQNRGGLETSVPMGCPGLARGYLRRRTPDEFFHFAFSDYYFGLLRSTVADYPVSGAVAASAAFPLLIDNTILKDFCDQAPRNGIRLMDGGANDNQALIEVYLVLSELALGQARSDLSVLAPGLLERMGPNDRAYLVVVNSSVTDSTGLPGTTGDQVPRSVPGALLSIVDKVSAGVDTYSAIGWDLRRQLYLGQGDRVTSTPGVPLLVPVNISLSLLDQYALGGTEAALRTKSGIGPEPSDVSDARVRGRILRQSAAYGRLMSEPGAREDLKLSHWHPQCYFDMRAELDASLVSVSADNQACLREAARWAGALQGQELCMSGHPPDGLDCSGGRVHLARPDVLAGELRGECHPKLPLPPGPDEIRSADATCRRLDVP